MSKYDDKLFTKFVCINRDLISTEKFLGYHGTSLSSAKSIMKNGIDPSKSSSCSGQVRGKGFYVSRKYECAQDYSKAYATCEYKTVQNKYGTIDIPIQKQGEQGIPTVLAVYLRGADYRISVDEVEDHNGIKQKYIIHGPISTTPNTYFGEDSVNSDKYKKGNSTPKFCINETYQKQYERVIREEDFNKLSFKIVDENFDISIMGEFNNHEF